MLVLAMSPVLECPWRFGIYSLEIGGYGMSALNCSWSQKEIAYKDTSTHCYFRKNLTPAVEPGDKGYSFLAYLTFSSQANGVSQSLSGDEKEIQALERDGLAVQVGTVMCDEIKDLLFYTRDPKLFLNRTKKIRDSDPKLKVSCEICEDPDWAQYRDLP